MKKLSLFFLFLMLAHLIGLLTGLQCARAEGIMCTKELLTRAVMNEAGGENFESKQAHAFMFVNRFACGMRAGSSGLYTKKVCDRLDASPEKSWDEARHAVASIAFFQDPTHGAVYCENVKAFGVPAHIKKLLRAGKVEKSAQVGDVVFWRVKKK